MTGKKRGFAVLQAKEMLVGTQYLPGQFSFLSYGGLVCYTAVYYPLGGGVCL
jgi:hypothetical protein